MSSNSHAKYWVALNDVCGVSSNIFFNLIERFSSPEIVWQIPEREIQNCEFLPPFIIRNILDSRNKFNFDKEIETADKEGISIITFIDKDYPTSLKNIEFPPPVIYVKGNLLEKDKQSIAIVGARKCSFYGRDIAEELASSLASRGFSVVSGLASGIDTSAHKGALKSGGRTLAILGSGLCYIYPKVNEKLSEQITTAGALISEFSLNTLPEKRHFPMRNRIISALSMGVIVVEAGEKSGSLITAFHALEQGKEVFAVPGNVKSLLSRGPHKLIKEGAKLVQDVSDVLSEFGIKEIAPQQKNIAFEANLSENEAKVYSVISVEPQRIDDIHYLTSLSYQILAATLLNLEIKKLIRQLPGKMFVKT